MTGRVQSELLLVGSLPVDSTESAFRTGTELFGSMIFAISDGETGPRRGWVAYERETLLRSHPDLVMVQPTESPTGIARHAYETPVFTVRSGVRALRFAHWPRIDDAIASYRVFLSLKRAGVVPATLRFQVCLPFPASVLYGFRHNYEADYPIVAAAFEDLAERGVRQLLSEIPSEDLAIQWDVCFEVLDLEGVLAWTRGDAWEGFAGSVRRLGPAVPEGVLLGYHLCYGTFPEWPMFEARDMGLLVRMANFAAANSGRTVDWLHMAGPRYLRSEDDRFFRPLAELKAQGARVFLGIVLPIDGISGLKRRYATARRHLADFGVALYCGFGRQPGENGMETLRNHRIAVESLRPRSAASH